MGNAPSGNRLGSEPVASDVTRPSSADDSAATSASATSAAVASRSSVSKAAGDAGATILPVDGKSRRSKTGAIAVQAKAEHEQCSKAGAIALQAKAEHEQRRHTMQSRNSFLASLEARAPKRPSEAEANPLVGQSKRPRLTPEGDVPKTALGAGKHESVASNDSKPVKREATSPGNPASDNHEMQRDARPKFAPAKREAAVTDTLVCERAEPMDVDGSRLSADEGSAPRSVCLNAFGDVTRPSSADDSAATSASTTNAAVASKSSVSKAAGEAGATILHVDGKSRRSKTGAIALQAKAEHEQRRREAEQKLKEEEDKREFKRTFGQVVANQDAEFEIGLLHDQVKSLHKERTSLRADVESMERRLEGSRQVQRNSESRLERYGENPKIRAEAEKAAEESAQMEKPLAEAEERLLKVETSLWEKETLLALQAISDEDM